MPVGGWFREGPPNGPPASRGAPSGHVNPAEHVARGTFETLSVARGTFGTSLPGRTRREGHPRDVATRRARPERRRGDPDNSMAKHATPEVLQASQCSTVRSVSFAKRAWTREELP